MRGIRNQDSSADHAMLDCLQDNLIEDILKDMGVFETSPSVPANGGMVRNFVGQSQTKKPTVCQIRLNLAFQLTLRTDAVK